MNEYVVNFELESGYVGSWFVDAESPKEAAKLVHKAYPAKVVEIVVNGKIVYIRKR